MSGSVKCNHPSKAYSLSSMADEALPGRVYVQMSVKCEACGARFRFLGIEPGEDPDAPAVNRSAMKIMLPLVEVA